MELRHYQNEAISRVHASFDASRSILLVLATGLGKTFVASRILLERRANGRGLWVAHTEELVQQAVASLEASGLTVEVEKASQRASKLHYSDVVVATVQTLKSQRLKSWDPQSFGTVVIDEAHHSVANSYQGIVNHFKKAQILGLTATPERSDKLALGQIFDEVAYTYGIKEGIEGGFLCPIIMREVTCADLDISKVRTVAGDLDAHALSEAINRDSVLHQICSTLCREASNRPTIAFWPTVMNAHKAARVMAGYLDDPNAVQVIEGNTPKDMRAQILERYKLGLIQYIFNCAVLTEGFDAPSTSCIAICRPTKSVALFRQMIGRGTRLASGKSDLLVIDFKGNAGKHSLVSSFDIFDGEMTAPEERAAIRKAVEEHPDLTMLEAHKLVKVQIAEEMARKEALIKESARVVADVSYRVKTYSPFGTTAEERRYNAKVEIRHRLPWERPATEAQRRALKYHYPELPDISIREASRLFEIARSKGPSLDMNKVLVRYNYDPSKMLFATAKKLIGCLKAAGWKDTPDIQAQYGKYKKGPK